MGRLDGVWLRGNYFQYERMLFCLKLWEAFCLKRKRFKKAVADITVELDI